MTARRAILLFGLMTLLQACTRESPERLMQDHLTRPPVVLFSIDTLRADRLPAYGYDAVETPNIDRLRRDSILFERAYAHVPLTLPSHASILTGHLPNEHGVRSNVGYSVPPDIPTLPEVLGNNGYATAGFVSSFVMRRETGIGRGFHHYDDDIPAVGGEFFGELQRSGDVTSALALDWLSRNHGKPPFLFVHLFDPHTPYSPPEPFRSRYAARPYDGEIATVDSYVGVLLDSLRTNGIYDDALIILLSDHGEGLGDHGEDEHGIFLYREAIQVPLLIKLPGRSRAGTTVSAPVQLVDVFPTILSEVGAPMPADLAGRSLLGELPLARPAYSETYYPRIHLGWSELRSIVSGTHHFIEAPTPELYDLTNDPAERRNIADDERRALHSLRDTLHEFARAYRPPETIDPETASKLAALGYLTGAPTASSGERPDPKDRIGELRLLHHALALARDGDHIGATESLRAVVGRNPQLTDAWSHLARSYEALGLHRQAVEAYERAIVLAPETAPHLALAMAGACLNLEDVERARAYAELAAKANRPASSLLLARIALVDRDLSAASARAEEAIADPSLRPSALIVYALVAVAEKRFVDALRLVDEAGEAAASNHLERPALSDYVRGNVFALTGRVDEAEQAFRNEIRRFPTEREAYAALTALMYLSGRAREADGTMSALFEAIPDQSTCSFAADVFASLGDTTRAGEWRACRPRR